MSIIERIPEHVRHSGIENGALIYIAGPMRGFHRYNFGMFEAVEKVLRDAGYPTINPHTEDKLHGFNVQDLPDDYNWSAYPPGLDGNFCIDRCLASVRACKGLVALPEWNTSLGARAEVALAQWQKSPVVFPEDYLKREVGFA